MNISVASQVSNYVLYIECNFFFPPCKRAGAVFPQRSERSAPIFTPPQTQPLRTYPPSLRSPEYQQEVPESSTGSDFPALRCILNFFYLFILYNVWIKIVLTEIVE